MPLLKKELERFIWEQPDACEARGLSLFAAFFRGGCRYHRLNLGAYGTAPLVSIRFQPATHCYYVQVVACTTGQLTTSLYQQAKRYAAGLKTILERLVQESGFSAQVLPHLVLVCQQVQRADNLLYTLNLDTSCQAFCYYYGLDGLRFRNVGKQWHLIGPTGLSPVQARLADDMRAERAEALRREQGARPLSVTAAPAELAESLVITASGIVERTDVAGEGQHHE